MSAIEGGGEAQQRSTAAGRAVLCIPVTKAAEKQGWRVFRGFWEGLWQKRLLIQRGQKGGPGRCPHGEVGLMLISICVFCRKYSCDCAPMQ